MEWDVKDDESTVNLLSKWMDNGTGAHTQFILAANFSGYLGVKDNLKKAQQQLNHIFMWAGTRAAQIIWLEPQTKIADTFLQRLYEKAKSSVQRLFSVLSEDPLKPHATTECIQQHPLAGQKTFSVRLSLMMLIHKDRTS